MSQLVPVALFERGYKDINSVIPPNATLSPGSKIAAAALGKAPGIKYGNGTWGGYAWRTHAATPADAQKWALDGANIGLRSGHFPGLDIDSMNESVALTIQGFARDILGEAPIRIGKPPKRLLMYRTDQPFARMRMWLEGETQTHLIELLGDGQQYLVHGTHPATMRPYSWNVEPPAAADLTPISAEKVELLFAKLRQHFTEMGFTVRREGDGRKHERTSSSDQTGLHAPAIESLQMAVAAIPNSGEMFATREQYIRMGAAIRAACGDQLEEGFDIWADWCSRWDGGQNDPDTVRADWRRLYPPFAIGWGWLAETARGFGYNDAPDEFPADPNAAPPPPPGPQRVRLSDVWLADKVVDDIGDRLRFVSARGAWYVWNAAQWVPDATESARYEVLSALRRLSAIEIESAEGDKGLAQAARDARHIESAHTLTSVMSLIRADRTIAVTVDALDAEPWLLNTPVGVVDLKTGGVTPGLPEQLHTKITRVGPITGAPIPEWQRFLEETTGGDHELIAYLQRLAGYCLTGLTAEQSLAFIWGPGGNGKSVFLNAISEAMGDYATVATMDVFTASNMERHTTDLADLMGARLVAASETQAGRRWDEQRLKLLSSGDRVKARFMRQDNVMYRPSFKLLFIGNHQPHIRNLDEAMRRRIHMIPFTRKPAVRDSYLSDKLREEYPGIIAWMIEGCLSWQKIGLQPPPVVTAQTSEYFDAEDLVGRWLQDMCDKVEGKVTPAGELYENWREWCGEMGERASNQRDLVQALRARGLDWFRHPTTRRGYFRGIAVNRAASMPMESEA